MEEVNELAFLFGAAASPDGDALLRVGEGSFKPAKETKQVPLDPANPKQCVTIGAGLSPK